MFELNGITDKNFIMNSGSYFILFSGLVLYYLGKYLLNSIAKLCPSYKYSRFVGIWAYENSYKGSLWIASLKLFIESYFDLTMCAAISLLSFMEIPKG